MSINVHVSGTVKIHGIQAPIKGATLKVELLDASRMDGEAKVLGVLTQHDINIPESSVMEGAASLVYSLEGEVANLTGINIVSAHLDLEGNGVVNLGDFITTGMHPVQPSDAKQVVDIQLNRVT